ncbi:MAG TPA: RNA polymerase sigma factor [Acidothermaceae bacterium]
MAAGGELVRGELSHLSASTEDTRAGELWLAHYGPLAGWCQALVGDPDVAHDIAAESFARLLGRLVRVRDPKAYLYVTTTRLVADHWRARARDSKLGDRIVLQERGRDVPDTAWLRDLVQRLPERLRTPVLLHYYAELPIADIAKALHRPVGTVKRQLAEGRATLLARIEDPR